MTPIPFDRSTMIDALRERAKSTDPLDVLVVGGGITGVGVALDAAARGLSTALVERDDFASGTSSKSSKFVHGGLRYLQNGEFRLVYEALRERRRLMRNAPHLVDVLPFLIPIFNRDGVVPRNVAWALGWAMWLYDLTGGWRIGKLHKRVSAARAAEYLPTIEPERMSGGYLYYDAAADDARLTLTIARTAAAHGAIVLNRCPVTGIDHDEAGRARAARVEIDGEALEVAARVIVIAAGVWSDDVRSLDESVHPDSIRPAKGTHVVVPWETTRTPISVIIPVKGDRRSLFLTPWGPNQDGTYRHTYIGTTDTDYEGPLDEPRCEADDVDYMLGALNRVLAEPIDRSAITGVWAGLRPLVNERDGTESSGKTADLSRQHVVAVSNSGVVRVNGGKLTTYREMAQDTVDRVMRELGRSTLLPSGRSTKRLRLIGSGRMRSAEAGTLDAHLIGRYGSLAPEIKALGALDPDLDRPLVAGQPYLRAEAVYAIRHEMATRLDDVLLRRTRAHLFDRSASLEAAPLIAELMAAELGWDDDERRRQIDEYRRICESEEVAGERVAHAAD